jgi:hypothetical protein
VIRAHVTTVAAGGNVARLGEPFARADGTAVIGLTSRVKES